VGAAFFFLALFFKPFQIFFLMVMLLTPTNACLPPSLSMYPTPALPRNSKRHRTETSNAELSLDPRRARRLMKIWNESHPSQNPACWRSPCNPRAPFITRFPQCPAGIGTVAHTLP
jgi:hypothetical protein